MCQGEPAMARRRESKVGIRKSREEKQRESIDAVAKLISQSRKLTGKPGDEKSDWEKAEKIVQTARSRTPISFWRSVLNWANTPRGEAKPKETIWLDSIRLKYISWRQNLEAIAQKRWMKWLWRNLIFIILFGLAAAIAIGLYQNCLNNDNWFDTEEIVLGRTCWDWLDLLVAPIIFALIGWIVKSVLENQEEERKRYSYAQEEERRRHNALKDYIEDITGLFTSEAWVRATSPKKKANPPLPAFWQGGKDGNTTELKDPEKTRLAAIAKARTLASLRELDNPRQIDLIRFLSESQQLKHFEFPGKKLDLRKVDLARANLQGANLGSANLEGANLRKANLQGANLDYANLQGADLSEAELEEAYLDYAKLQGADLRFAELEGDFLNFANLEGANLERANLEGAYLREANLQGANLGSANLEGAFLYAANLKGAILLGANLQESGLYAANLQEADLRYANLQGADLGSANLERANLGGANLERGMELTEEQLTQAKLCHTNMPYDITLDPKRDCEELGVDPETGFPVLQE